MADAITIKALQDASLDAKSLEEVVNGDEAKQVTTRKGESYPSVKKAIKTLFDNGGLPATPFATKALMTASALVDGKYAMVTDDADDNNGLYVKTAGAWVKSSYDPLSNAIDYADTYKTDKSVVDNDDSKAQLLVFCDADNNVVLNMANNGDVFLSGDSTSVQEQLKTPDRNYFDDSNAVEKSIDKDGVVVALQARDGESYIPNLERSIQGELRRMMGVINAQNSIMRSDTNVAVKNGARALMYGLGQDSDTANLKTIAAYEETESVQRIASILKVDDNTILYVWGGGIQGYSGDGEGVKLYKRLLRINRDYSVTPLESKVLVAEPAIESGVSKHPMLGRTGDGRIILVYDERESISETYRQYVRFSNDGGKTFGEKSQIPHHPELDGVVVALGSTGQILTTDTGRILVPFYSTGSNSWICYSDNNGGTWTHGNILPNSGVEPTICFDKNGHILMSLRKDGAEIRTKVLAKSIDNGVNLELIGHHTDLSSNPCASTLLYDEDFNVIFHGTPKKNLHGTTRRYQYQIQMSFDDGTSFPVCYQPFDSEFYVGYSQMIKITKGVYAVAMEGLTYAVGTNTRENAGIFIFNLKEAFQNVVNS